MHIDDIHARIRKLCSVSPTVQAYIENEEYNADVEDTIMAPTTILLSCYRILKDELEELGILFLDPDRMLSNFYSADVLYHLRKIFSFPELYPMLKEEKHRALMESFLEDDRNTVDQWIEYLYEMDHDKDTFLLEEAVLETELTARFNDHIQAIFNYIDEFDKYKQPDLEDIEATTKFVMKASETKTLLTSLLQKIKIMLPKNTYAEVEQRIVLYDDDKFRPDVINIYAMQYSENSLDVDNKLYNRAQDLHHLRTKHHIEYWISRKESGELPTQTDLVELLLSLDDDHLGYEHLTKELDSMIKSYPFNKQQIQFMETIAKAFYR